MTKSTVFAAMAVLALAATGCASTTSNASPATAHRECTAPGAYVVNPATNLHGFATGDASEPRVQTLDALQLQGRGVVTSDAQAVPARTAADTSTGRGNPTCF